MAFSAFWVHFSAQSVSSMTSYYMYCSTGLNTSLHLSSYHARNWTKARIMRNWLKPLFSANSIIIGSCGTVLKSEVKSEVYSWQTCPILLKSAVKMSSYIQLLLHEEYYLVKEGPASFCATQSWRPEAARWLRRRWARRIRQSSPVGTLSAPPVTSLTNALQRKEKLQFTPWHWSSTVWQSVVFLPHLNSFHVHRLTGIMFTLNSRRDISLLLCSLRMV